jgi:metal-responsive CopG/Arc/MetJ family transcriptional regulator
VKTNVVPLRIDKITLDRIDEMVESDLFKSRNEAINAIIKNGIKSYDVWSKIISISKSYDNSYDAKVSFQLDHALDKFLMDRDRF